MGRNKIRVPRFGMSVALTEGHVERGGGEYGRAGHPSLFFDIELFWPHSLSLTWELTI